MQKQNQLENILFLDIETVPQTYSYKDIDVKTKELFDSKVRFRLNDENTYDELYERNAAIFAEFGKIVCISVGFVRENNMERSIRLKSFYHDDEKTLLIQFKKLLEEHYNAPFHVLCGHNAKEFDFPYLCRRMLINGVSLPNILNISGKKPWEIKHLDTMELWKFGDFKAYTSLALLCHVFEIPTPKDDISGADVARVYYEENDLERIARYCEKDVSALIQLFLRMKGEELVADANISIVE
ncbi:MAG: 3'-5' exonuclease [Crocinitomicaceae bacterium]|nr:3'-5' exonuclease [Crocinitomicaceae bacterium]